MSSKDSNQLLAAMQDEIESLKKNKTCIQTKRLERKIVVGCK